MLKLLRGRLRRGWLVLLDQWLSSFRLLLLPFVVLESGLLDHLRKQPRGLVFQVHLLLHFGLLAVFGIRQVDRLLSLRESFHDILGHLLGIDGRLLHLAQLLLELVQDIVFEPLRHGH